MAKNQMAQTSLGCNVRWTVFKPHVTSGTTKTVLAKNPKNGGSTPTPCLDKAVLAQGGGGGGRAGGVLG